MLKKIFNKKSVTAIIFLGLIVVTFAFTVLNNRNEIKFNDMSSLDLVFSEKLVGFNDYINIWAMNQKLIGTQLFDDAEYGYVIKDSQGKLHFPVSAVDVSADVDGMLKFAADMEEMGIPLVYIQAPNKKLKGYTEYPRGAYNYSNENADAFLEKINESGIDTLDLRELIISQNLDRYSLFYITDHHWQTPAAFWAFSEVVSYLNSTVGLNIDSDGFFRDIDNYTQVKYEKCFLGSQGRRVGEKIAGLDDYIFIYPNFETDYDIFTKATDTEPTFTGDFRKSIVRDYLLTSEDVMTNRYTAYFEWDYGNLIIKNNLVDNDIKILLIKDSFALPFAAFLSTCVSELHMLDVRKDSAPITYDYIKEHGFDAVVIMYNPTMFAQDMFEFYN